MNIGFLKGFLSYNIFNLISQNSFQKTEDLLIDFNQYSIGIQIQNLYQNFIENSFYQLACLLVVFSILLLSYLLKSQSGSLIRLYEYMNINGIIRYFMITSNFILLYSFYSIKLSNYTIQGNVYFIAFFGFIYFTIQIYCFYGLSFSNFANYTNKYQVLQEGIIQHQTFSKLFWTIFEIRKIVCTACIVFSNEFEYCGVIMAGSSILFLIYNFIAKPITKKCDQIVIFFSEAVCIGLFIIFSLISNRNNWKISNQIATNLAITFIMLSLSLSVIFILLFFINTYQSFQAYRTNRNRQSIIQRDKLPVIQQFKKFNSFKEIELALTLNLNNSKFSAYKFTKKQF
ncbi:transmembrane protein, putative (macronuclear) [Tetrahymena thermophila SB210]|uniref:Transmembrane protein, putative n=1 Tax=Tetrahymena thermophila (strain SB210) TaxID=312017 RepID=W7XKJ6_TETTS|nr:transmembrane protein, putative [Tetrahymena thermophila SB210]EWS74959.1 transmembrane protein, putative [Tetrahymena thermophila SB210]|eukprot:XP_012652500.1 transmembrane protein, putative [Tetrahymena thermophila SB210]